MNKDANDKFLRLKNWIIDNGGYVSDSVAIRELSADNRTLVATEDIEKGSVLVRLPKDLLIHEDSIIKRVPPLEPLLSKNNLEKFEKRLTFLLYEAQKHGKAGAGSFYSPYLDILPTIEDIRSHPLFCAVPANLERWAEVDKGFSDFFKASFNNVVSYRNKLLLFNKETSNLFDDEYTDFGYILWGFIVMMSRQFDASGLVPMVDMFQHRSGHISFLQKDYTDMNVLECITRAACSENKEIFNNYGHDDEIDVLRIYGFIDENNDQHFVLVPFNNLSGNNITEAQKSVLNKLRPKTYFYLTSNGPSEMLISYLRALCATPEELADFPENDIDRYLNKQISVGNEYMVAQKLLSIINDLKGNVAASLEYCSELINKKIDHPVTILLARAVSHKHQVLNECLKIAQNMKAELSKS
ncbi:MAG: SET domain-containing protein [Candidatus Margulisiibacteriota bacterium]